MDRERLVPLAEIARPHGVRGEVRLKLYNAESDLLLEVDEVVADFPSKERDVLAIESARRAGDALLVRFRGYSDRDAVEELRGVILSLPRQAFPEPEEGEVYACDLEGATVIAPEGEIGKVETLVSYPSCDALVVVAEGGRIEVPFVDSVVEDVDVANRIVRVVSRDVLEPK